MRRAVVRSGELSVTELARTVEMKPPAVSNQLLRLVARGVLAAKRNGNNIPYKIIDPCVINLLDRQLCLIEDAKNKK